MKLALSVAQPKAGALALLRTALAAALLVIAALPLLAQSGLLAGQVIEQGAAIVATGDDVLLFRLATPAQSQQLPLLLTWTQDGTRRNSMMLTVLADGGSRRLRVPVGAHPGWRGEVGDLGLAAPYKGVALPIKGPVLLRAPLLAPDLWLLRALYPALPELPPPGNVQLLLVAALGAGAALALPWRDWRRRLALFGLLLVLGAAVGTLFTQIQVLRGVVAFYGPLDDRAAAAQAPSYTAEQPAIAQLVAVVDELPAGPVLLLDVSPTSDLLFRARYLLYPRRVDVRSPQNAPDAIPQLLNEQYDAAIQLMPTAQPPVTGWVQIAAPPGPLAIWRAPGASPAPPGPTAHWPVATVPLLGGLAVVVVAGWLGGGALGWRGALRLGAAWPLGAALLAWWMWLLDLLGLPWSIWSIGTPLLVVAGLASWRSRRRGAVGREQSGGALHQRAGFMGGGLRELWRWRAQLPAAAQASRSHRWLLVGWAAIGALTACLLLQATTMPFTDRDSWAMWGLKGRAFFLDGSLRPVLALYRGWDAHHTSYPPAQPLAQAWLYLAMGGISERLVKVIFPLWYLAGLLLTWWLTRRWSSPLVAMWWALLLATTPLYLDHATLGNADLPLAVALLLGALCLTCWLEDGGRLWIVSGVVALGAAAWIKLDGLYLGAGMLLAALLVQALEQRRARGRLRQLTGQGLLAGGLFAALTLPWLAYTQLLSLNDIPSLGTNAPDRWSLLMEGLGVLSAELLLSYNNSSLGLLGGGYGVFWFVCLGALLIGWRRLRDDAVLWFLLLSLAGGFAFYLAIYAVRPYYSVERYLLHIAPLALLAAARAGRGAFTMPARPAPSAGGSRAAAGARRRRKGRR